MKLLKTLCLVLVTAFSVPAAAQDPALNGMENLRQKIKTEKKRIVSANLVLADSEAKAFWPLYDAYQADLKKINDRLLDLVKEYAAAYNNRTITNESATKMLKESFAIEEAEIKLKRSYVSRMEKVIPGVQVVRYIQIENKIRAVGKYELAAQIPFVQ